MTTLPVIHLNGTSADSLCAEYYAARMEVRNAIDALVKCTCNARDFYPHRDTLAWAKARNERESMLAKLHEVHQYLEDWEARAAEHKR